MTDDVPPPDRRPTRDELLARFLEAHPDAGSEQFEVWLVEHVDDLADARVAAMARDVLARLDDSEPDESIFAPPDGGRGGDSAAPSAFAPGQRVGPFELRRFVAAGGMGQVWEAQETELGRTVALKLLLYGGVDPRALERFAREARAGGRPHHPSLVATYAHGSDGGVQWISQEFVPGARTLVDSIGELREADTVSRGHYREVAESIADLAEGLHAAHEAGVIHRDVKPANVLVAPDGALRLTDFGLARVTDESLLSRSGELAGTWAYMSPEQARARPRGIDRRTDVFSLGVVLYELLTQRRPFTGDTVQQTVEQILAHDPPAPSELRSGCPRDLSLICLKAIEKSPARRYATAADLATDLRRHLANETIIARAPTLGDRAGRWVRRNPTASTAGAIGLVALVLVSILLARRVSDARALALSAEALAEEAQAVEAERESLLRLAAQVELDGLLASQADMWPPSPEGIGALGAWLDDARRLVATLPTHRAKLAELTGGEDGALPGDSADWWRARLGELVEGLEGLRALHLDPGAANLADGWSVTRRLEFAQSVASATAEGGWLDVLWDDALPRLRAAHPSVDSAPWPFLVPLGPDPDSGLWEFAHLATGTVPERGADGRLAPADDMAVVLVLLDGGESWLGMQRDDPDAPNHDANSPPFGGRPVRLVTLSPYLIGKYELTRGQWRTLTGEDPSSRSLDEEGVGLTHPVEEISWDDAWLVLGRIGLTLPSEAQWEHACRAGTSTPFHGGFAADMDGLMNVAGRTALAAEPSFSRGPDSQNVDDGAVYDVPVGTFPPNAFGLHEMHGNIWEWVRDAARFEDYAADEGAVDPLIDPSESDMRLLRGGSFRRPPFFARSWFRLNFVSSMRGDGYGARVGYDRIGDD